MSFCQNNSVTSKNIGVLDPFDKKLRSIWHSIIHTSINLELGKVNFTQCTTLNVLKFQKISYRNCFLWRICGIFVASASDFLILLQKDSYINILDDLEPSYNTWYNRCIHNTLILFIKSLFFTNVSIPSTWRICSVYLFNPI